MSVGRPQTTHEGVTLAAVAALVGDDAAVALARARGGIRVYIPNRPDPSSELAAIIGFEATRVLARHYGGIEFLVARTWSPEERVWALFDAGRSASQIAQELGRSLRYVRAVKARGRQSGRLAPRRPRGYDPDQQGLFGDE